MPYDVGSQTAYMKMPAFLLTFHTVYSKMLFLPLFQLHFQEANYLSLRFIMRTPKNSLVK